MADPLLDAMGRTLGEGAVETLRMQLMEHAIKQAQDVNRCANCQGTGQVQAQLFVGPCPICKAKGYLPWELSSGREAAYYIDVSQVSMDEPGWSALCVIMAEIAHERQCLQIGGLIAGGVPLAMAAMHGARRYGRDWQMRAAAFQIRDGRKQHGTGGIWAGYVCNDDPTMVVDDVTSTGRTMVEAIHRLRDKGVRVEHAFSLIDRGKGADALIERETGVSYSYGFTEADLGIEH